MYVEYQVSNMRIYQEIPEKNGLGLESHWPSRLAGSNPAPSATIYGKLSGIL